MDMQHGVTCAALLALVTRLFEFQLANHAPVIGLQIIAIVHCAQRVGVEFVNNVI